MAGAGSGTGLVARLYRPAPPGAPDPAGEELPVVAVLAGRRQGDRVAADLARLDPYGIGLVETGDGQCIVTVVGATGAELLMELPADSPALADLRRRLHHSKGRHVVMFADAALLPHPRHVEGQRLLGVGGCFVQVLTLGVQSGQLRRVGVVAATRLRRVRGMEAGARITAKGQVTIPVAVRRALDLDVGDEVIFEVDLGPGGPRAQVRKAADFLALAGSVPVPAEWAGADWPTLRAAAWSAQSERHGKSA